MTCISNHGGRWWNDSTHPAFVEACSSSPFPTVSPLRSRPTTTRCSRCPRGSQASLGPDDGVDTPHANSMGPHIQNLGALRIPRGLKRPCHHQECCEDYTGSVGLTTGTREAFAHPAQPQYVGLGQVLVLALPAPSGFSSLHLITRSVNVRGPHSANRVLHSRGHNGRHSPTVSITSFNQRCSPPFVAQPLPYATTLSMMAAQSLPELRHFTPIIFLSYPVSPQ